MQQVTNDFAILCQARLMAGQTLTIPLRLQPSAHALFRVCRGERFIDVRVAGQVFSSASWKSPFSGDVAGWRLVSAICRSAGKNCGRSSEGTSL
jgi:hypothetical protein